MRRESSISTYLAAAVRAAQEAGDLLQSRFGRSQKISFKGTIDLVTEMDHRSQSRILRLLRREFPDHDVLSEEQAPSIRTSPFQWIIDPLDGTTNYAHGFPIYCVSIALAIAGRVEVGVVNCPTLREMFTATRGRGARLNGRRLRVSKTAHLDQALLATGFPYDIRTSARNNVREFTAFAMRAQAVRRAGAAALDLCFLAAGRFDGFWEMKLRSWDIAAGLLMVREAGGVATDFDGKPIELEADRVLASNGSLHEPMLRVLASTTTAAG